MPEVRTGKGLGRNPSKKKEIPRVLIVCEGEKTEPNYFEEIRKYLRLSSAKVTAIPSVHTQPLKIAQYAIEYFLENGRKWDEVYCVFDRDEHDGFCDAIQKIRQKKLKNDYKNKVNFQAIPSNPCFELWLLIHFEKWNKCAHRHVIQHRIKTYLTDYKKGKDDCFMGTMCNIENAYARAKDLRSKCIENEILFNNPSTDIDLLVKKLLSLRA